MICNGEVTNLFYQEKRRFYYGAEKVSKMVQQNWLRFG